MTKRFVSEGCKVVIIDLNGQQAVEELGSDHVALVTGDVSKRDTWEKALELAKQKFGGLHILVVRLICQSAHTKRKAHRLRADFVGRRITQELVSTLESYQQHNQS